MIRTLSYVDHSTKRPVKGGPAYLEQVGHVLATLAVLDHLSDVLDSLDGELRLARHLAANRVAQRPRSSPTLIAGVSWYEGGGRLYQAPRKAYQRL